MVHNDINYFLYQSKMFENVTFNETGIGAGELKRVISPFGTLPIIRQKRRNEWCQQDENLFWNGKFRHKTQLQKGSHSADYQDTGIK